MDQTARRLEAVGPPEAPSVRELPLIIDTDIGGDPDDMFALAIAAKRDPQLSLVVTSDELGGHRARLARHVLDLLGRTNVAVVAGTDLGSNNYSCFDGLIPETVPRQPSDVTAAVLHVLNRGKGNVRWLGIGPMSNLATLLKKNNTVAKRLHVVQMGGAIKYRKPGVAEHNFRMDPSAVAYVFPQLVRPELVLSDATFRPEIEITQQSELFQKLATTEEPWVQLLVAHCQQFFARHHPGTMMHDPLALTVAMELPFTQGGFGRILRCVGFSRRCVR